MLEREVAGYIWVHSKSLIKNLNPFEDDAEIRLLNFLPSKGHLTTRELKRNVFFGRGRKA